MMNPEDEEMEDVYDDDYDEVVSDDDNDDDDDDDDELPYDDDNKDTGDQHYTVLEEADIRRRQKNDVSHVSSTLFITEDEASKLLYHYKWDVTRLEEEWFADQEKVRGEVGLLFENLEFPSTDELATCGICFDLFPLDDEHFYPIACGHTYCLDCWKGYFTNSIEDGPGCLTLRCPEPQCPAAICRDMIGRLASEEEKEKYDRFFLRSYVEHSKKTKWCPAPGCQNAVEFDFMGNGYDVECKCSHPFCYNCTEDAHRPLDCETVDNWIKKNSDESENTVWMLANSKPCPKCKRAIEKNQGCMHMKCTEPCNFHFCWLCLGDWFEHGGKTGGYYACNKYEVDRKQGLLDKEETERLKAKHYIKKYTHYFERWVNNEKSRGKAAKDLHLMETEKLALLSAKLGIPETELVFITDAWKQVIECRRVLKWTYAYGYYIPDGEMMKKNFFELSQGDAETRLEKLHQCVEKELSVFLRQKEVNEFGPKEAKDKEEEETKNNEELKEFFRTFPLKLKQQTAATRGYFAKLVSAIESNFSGLISEAASGEGSSSFGVASSSNWSDRPEYDSTDRPEYWSCLRCTFANPGQNAFCVLCFTDRPY